MVAFIYFHFMGDRNLSPPPRIADAPGALILPAASEHLHELLTKGGTNHNEASSPPSGLADVDEFGTPEAIRRD